MLKLTENAVKKALQLAEKDGRKPLLRVGVKGGGCTGYSYVLDFVESERDSDQHWEYGALRVVCDPKSLAILEGTIVDYETNLMNAGFKFNNPRAKKSCGCGESFAI